MTKTERQERIARTIRIQREAVAAGVAAAEAAKPAPMIVQDADLFGGPLPGGQTYFIPEGPCGFAWVRVTARTPEGRRFIADLKLAGIASPDINEHRPWRRDDYSGGYMFWVSTGGQGITRKEAFAHAFAAVLEENGVPAFAASRLD